MFEYTIKNENGFVFSKQLFLFCFLIKLKKKHYDEYISLFRTKYIWVTFAWNIDFVHFCCLYEICQKIWCLTSFRQCKTNVFVTVIALTAFYLKKWINCLFLAQYWITFRKEFFLWQTSDLLIICVYVFDFSKFLILNFDDFSSSQFSKFLLSIKCK